jgi:histidyl-tRNA synthetase
VGFGLGLERTILLLESQDVKPVLGSGVDVYIVALGDRAEKATPVLLQQLRSAGIAAERDYLGRKTKAQFKAADRLGARFVAVVGDDELDRGEISLKRLATGEQQAVPLNGLTKAIQTFISTEEKGNINL